MSIQSQDKEQKDNEEYSKNFARIPNMLFVSFKYLSKEEKFLYCTLKSIYWDAKPRYVSLRDLGGMCGYSAGALHKMLPRLHKCGLIHAEIRREKRADGSDKGNAKYNITILDIWELNRQFFSCSPNERDLLDPSLKLVHESEQACSPNEQGRSPNDTSLFTKSNKTVHQMNESSHPSTPVEQVKATSKEKKEREKTPLKKERETPPVQDQHPKASSLSPSGFSSQDQGGVTNPPASVKGVPALDLTEEESVFWTRWCAVSGCSYESLNQNAYNHVNFFASKALTTEELQSLYDYKYAQIREYSASLGKPAIPPRLGNLVKAYPEWEKTRERVEEHKQHEHVPGSGHMRNYTRERLEGRAEPITYAPLPTERRPRPTVQKGLIDKDDELTRLHERRRSSSLPDNGKR